MTNRVIVFLTDDQRWDDYYATLESGPRAGQLAMQQVHDRLMALGMTFNRARGDMSFCQPARTAIMSGNQRQNHGVNDISASGYYKHTRQGFRDTQVWSGVREWEGPWEIDLAKQAGLDDTPVVASSQPLGTFTNNVRNNVARGDTTDDLQAFTGSIANWLSVSSTARADTLITEAGDTLLAETGDSLVLDYAIKVFEVGKYMNGYGLLATTPWTANDPTGDYWSSATTYASGDRVAYLGRFYTSNVASNLNNIPASSPTQWTAGDIARTTRFVPPGHSHWKVVVPDDQDHYHMNTVDFTDTVGGTNPGDGNGQIGRQSTYDYDWPISAVSWSGGVATITLTTVPSVIENGVTIARPVEVGDEVAVDGVTTATGYNFGYKTVTVKVSNTQFKVAMAVAPTGTPGLTAAMCYPRKLHSEQILCDDFIAYMDTLTDADDMLGFYGCRMPHSSTPAAGGDAVQNERRYDNSGGQTVTNAQAYRWGGTYGAHSPAMTTSATESGSSSHQKNWAQRAEMIATADDIVGRILDYCDGRWGTSGYTFMFVSDNGFQTGDHADTEGSDSWDFQGGKLFLWESSLRVPLIIRGPGFAAGSTWERNVQLADIPLTLLDLFGLTTHHAHTKRDGRSILRELVLPQDRAILCTGKYLAATWGGLTPQTNTNQGIIDSANGTVSDPGWKLIRRTDNHAARILVKAFDFTEYETVNHENDSPTTQALANTLAGKCDRAMTARWDPANNRHTKDDINGYTTTTVTGTSAGAGGGTGAATGTVASLLTGLGQGVGGGQGTAAGVVTQLGTATGAGGGTGSALPDIDPYDKVMVLDANYQAILDF